MGFGFTELVKHIRYKSLYKPNELYWGIGIEEETYLQFTKPIYVATPIIRTCHKAERYSVKYYSSYHSSYIVAFAHLFPDASGCVPLPFFLNAHAFNAMDCSGNHVTTYKKVSKPNPNFSGTTFFQALSDFRPSGMCYTPKRFSEVFQKSCIFDGDTLEFMTQDFYKAKVGNVIQELVTCKKELLDSINSYLIEKKLHREKGLLMYPEVNPGFAVYYTNPKNVAMFNNGTYHINITLPTVLGEYDMQGVPKLLDYKAFMYDHMKFIRVIQWLEPFIIGFYGSKDPLSAVSSLYSKGSQRCALSRYIGIGSYDTLAMLPGKILTMPVEKIRGHDTGFWWYKTYHLQSGYAPLKELGMDINFRKHYNHGVEIRFLDWFPESELKGLMEFYVYLADASLSGTMPLEAIMNEEWNNLVVGMLQEGKEYIVSRRTLEMYELLLGMSLKEDTLENVFGQMCSELKKKYKKGLCAKYML